MVHSQRNKLHVVWTNKRINVTAYRSNILFSWKRNRALSTTQVILKWPDPIYCLCVRTTYELRQPAYGLARPVWNTFKTCSCNWVLTRSLCNGLPLWRASLIISLTQSSSQRTKRIELAPTCKRTLEECASCVRKRAKRMRCRKLVRSEKWWLDVTEATREVC